MESGEELNQPVNEDWPHSWVYVCLTSHVVDVREETAAEFWGTHPGVDLVGVDHVRILMRPGLPCRCSILLVDYKRDKGIRTLGHFQLVDSRW